LPTIVLCSKRWENLMPRSRQRLQGLSRTWK